MLHEKTQRKIEREQKKKKERTLNLKLFLKRESLRGERGEEGFEPKIPRWDLADLGVDEEEDEVLQ